MASINILKNLKYHMLFKKRLVISIICSKCNNKDRKIFKEEPTDILKILDLIINIEEYQNEYD